MTTTDESASTGRVPLFGAVAIGIGGMVGGGIFAVLGVAAESAGGATPLAFAIAGLVAALTAHSYAKLSVAYPSPGGTVTFIDKVFGVGRITASTNVLLWMGYVATTALYAAAFGSYAATLLPGDVVSGGAIVKALAILGVALPWFVNLADASLITRTEGIIVAFKLLILLVVLAAGIPTAEPERLAPSEWASPLSIIAAGMLIFVAYEGFELISNASHEIVDGPRNLPRAYALSIGIVIVLYVGISAVVVGSLTASEIEQSADFALAEAASSSLGSTGFVLVGVSAVMATFSAINATLYGAARLSFALALEGELPYSFRRQPWHQPLGLHVTAFAGGLIAIGLPLASISSLSSSIFLIVFAVVNAAAFRTARQIGAPRAVGALGLVACTGSLLVLTIQNVQEDRASLLVLGALAALAFGAERILRPGERSDV